MKAIKGTFMILFISAVSIFILNSSFNDKHKIINKDFQIGSMTDIDGNIYKTIKIGEQEWMLENLKVTKYRNGDDIPIISDNNLWGKTLDGACCYYENNSRNSEKFGMLYNFHTVKDNRNVAPEGWHVPADSDWMVLIAYLGGDDKAGTKLKEAGTKNWDRPNSNADNSSGYTALPGGVRYLSGKYYNKGTGAYWWSSSESAIEKGICYHVYYFFDNIYRYNQHKEMGISIRCIKD